MKLAKALDEMNTNGIMRDCWPYYLKFSRDGYLTLCDSVGELSPYSIHAGDLSYDWKITNE